MGMEVLRLAKAVKRLSRAIMLGCMGLAMVYLLVIVLLTTVDVFLRGAFNRPLAGVIDLTQTMLVIVAWLGVAWVTVKERHICVDVLVPRWSPRAQAITESFNTLLSFGFFAVIAWISTRIAIQTWQLKMTLDILPISLAPFKFCVSFGAFLLCVELLFRFVEQVTKVLKGTGGADLKETQPPKEERL